MIKYKVIVGLACTSPTSPQDTLEYKVNAMLEDGWILHGNMVSIDDGMGFANIAQAMIKEVW